AGGAADALLAHGGVEALVELGGEERARGARLVLLVALLLVPALAAEVERRAGARAEGAEEPAQHTVAGLAPLARPGAGAAGVGEGLEDAHRLVEVVAHHVALPALAGGLEEVAQAGPEAGDLAPGQGVAGWGGVVGAPAVVVDEDLDPGVGV